MQMIMLNVTPGSIPAVAHVSQCDYKKPIALELYDGDEVYTIPSGATVSICGTKADGHPFNYNSVSEPEVVSYSGNTVMVYTTVQMTAAAGNATCELKIESSGATIYSANYIMDVEASALPQDLNLSEMDIPLIIKAIEGGEAVAGIEDKITQAEEILSHMDDNVQESDTAAANAKASATASANSATASANSSSAAKSSQTAAKTSETNAKTSETAAKASQTAAASSEKNAKASETAAKTSETNAASSATKAAASQTAAKTSETNAAASASAAKTSETNAKTSETNAASSKTAAASSASAAKTSETNAASSKTAAANSATAAAASQKAAKTSETNAETYAKMSKSYAVGGTGTRNDEDTDNVKYYWEMFKDSDVGNLTELEKLIERNLNSINHNQDVYPAFFADRLTGITNLNECLTNGLYQFVASATNAPFTAAGLVGVFNSSGTGETGYIAQYAWALSDAHTVWARDDHGGTWGAWKKVSADVDTALSASSTNAVQNKAIVNGGATIINALGTSTTALADTDTTIIGTTRRTMSLVWTYIQNKISSVLGITKATFDEKSNKADTVKSLSVSGKTVTVTKGDGTTSTLTTQDTTYSAATTSAAGLMSAADKVKLNGIATGATKVTVDSGLSSSSTNPVQNKVINTALGNKADASAFNTVKTEVNARPKTRKLATQTLTASGGTLTWTDSCITDDSLIDVYASIPNIAPSAITQSGTTVTVTFDAQSDAFSVAIVVMN